MSSDKREVQYIQYAVAIASGDFAHYPVYLVALHRPESPRFSTKPILLDREVTSCETRHGSRTKVTSEPHFFSPVGNSLALTAQVGQSGGRSRLVRSRNAVSWTSRRRRFPPEVFQDAVLIEQTIEPSSETASNSWVLGLSWTLQRGRDLELNSCRNLSPRRDSAVRVLDIRVPGVNIYSKYTITLTVTV